jgi:hypothetical protein
MLVKKDNYGKEQTNPNEMGRIYDISPKKAISGTPNCPCSLLYMHFCARSCKNYCRVLHRYISMGAASVTGLWAKLHAILMDLS